MLLDQFVLEVVKVLLLLFRVQFEEISEFIVIYFYFIWLGYSKISDFQSSCYNWLCFVIEIVIKFD